MNNKDLNKKGQLPNIIEVQNLYKEYGEKDSKVSILKGIDLNICEGEFVSIMGPSGCGKSTLLFIIGGLDKPTSGNVLINSVDMMKLNDKQQSRQRRKDIGFVFQFYNLVPNLSVEENILLPITMNEKSTRDYKDRLESLLEIIELKDKRKYLPRQLSGGQQQRVAIARAIITMPSIILADEPVGNLDSVSGEKIMTLFSDINKQYGITILQVTHDESKALYGDRIINLVDGKVMKDELIK